MKHLTTYIITIIFLTFPAPCLSSYRIDLKNGARFTTEKYWVEDNQICFYANGGIMGVEKNSIRNITESETTYSKESQPLFKPPIPKTDKTLSLPQITKEPFPSQTDPPDKEALIEEKERIVTEIRYARAAFQEAKAKKDDKQMRTERKKLLSLHTQRSNLFKRVKDAYGAQVPAWWHADEPPTSTE